MGEKLSVVFLGETVLIVLTICNNLPLTDQNDKSIIQNDKNGCHNDANACRREARYDPAKSPEGAQSRAECQSAGDGEAVRRVAADD